MPMIERRKTKLFLHFIRGPANRSTILDVPQQRYKFPAEFAFQPAGFVCRRTLPITSKLLART
jgi:hypothetical protein